MHRHESETIALTVRSDHGHSKRITTRFRLVTVSFTLWTLAALVSGCTGQSGSLGERIYRDGHGARGKLEVSQGPQWFSHGTFGCVTCHGENGQGRFVRAGAVVASAPPVSHAVLRARGYDRSTLARAILSGIAVDGTALNYYMPRWQLDSAELESLLDYVESL